MKFGKLLNRFSQYVLIFMRESGRYRIRKGQSVMIPINLINRDKSIWGEDATEFKLVLFLFSLLFGYSTCFFFSSLDLSVGRIFRMLPLLFLESGRTFCHSLGDLELVSVLDFHLWSEFVLFSSGHICISIVFLIIFLNFSLPVY